MSTNFIKSILLVILLTTSNCFKFDPKDIIRRPEEEITTSQEYIEMAGEVSKYYKYFYPYGYCSPENFNAGECCKSILPQKKMETKNGWTLIDYGRTQRNCYSDKYNHYSIVRNDEIKKVVISFPGTYGGFWQGVSEMLFSELVNVDLLTFNDRNIKAALYFYERTKDLLDIVFSQENMENMKINEGYQIIFIGHSLGAAVGEIMALLTLDREYITREKNHPVIISFGSPRVGNEAFALTIQEEVEVIFRNTNEKDFVPQIPFYLSGFRHTNGRIYLSGEKEEYKVVNTDFNYQTKVVNDSQDKSLFEILSGMIKGFDVHTFYYGIDNNYCWHN